MNFVVQLEEYLRDLGAEARKNHPGVKEASERAILKLRSLQNQYVTAVRKASAQGDKHPDTTLFRSSDLLHPFLLAANYPNASSKLLDTSFKAMKSLMEANAICPGDGMNMVRVWIIQAHVVVSYSSTTTQQQQQQKKKLSKSSVNSDKSGYDTDASRDESLAGSAATTTTTTTTGAAPSSSSWFGSLLSSSTSSAAETMKSTANSVVNKTAVSSSHGQAGSGHINAKFLEKLALDILSCLLQLLELKDLPVSKEQWTQSVTLCCLFLKLKQLVVRQAASSTLPQVLNLLFKSDEKFAIQTWEDLTLCMSSSGGSGSSSVSVNAHSKKKVLHGAFAQCRVGEKDAPIPPSLAVSLHLMAKLLKENPSLFKAVGQKTLGVLVHTFQKMKTKSPTNPLDYIRTLQFISVVLHTQADTWTGECREVMRHVIEPITNVTDALRHQPEFEDGYVYRNAGDVQQPVFEVVKSIPGTTLWKAGLCIETLKLAIYHPATKSLWSHHDVLLPLVEAISDFCTIGASCRDNIHLLVGACRQSRSLLFLAETISTSNDDDITWWSDGRDSEQNFVLGNALWTGLETLLKLIDPQLEKKIFESAFSPFLAVLQHCLKRFPASGTIVKRSLEGYYKLATIASKVGPLLRCALMTSLCKLSLPQWGTLNSQSKLRDNHVASLICLLNIIHKLHDHVGSDWQVVMQTFEELSILRIASPHLSDNAYESALCVSAVFGRFATFSTCLSDNALRTLAENLMTVVVSTSKFSSNGSGGSNGSMGMEDGMELSGAANGGGRDEKGETIGGKLMHLGVRALYGTNDNAYDSADDVPLTSRTKETFCYHYKSEISRRLAKSKHPIRNENLRFSTALLCDIALANQYRYDKIGPVISTQLCLVASRSQDDRHFALDSLAMISLSHLADSFVIPDGPFGPSQIKYEDPRQNQYLIVQAATTENEGGDKPTISQKDLLAPLCSCILIEGDHRVAASALFAMHSIVESAGHRLVGSVWISLIDAIASINNTSRASAEWKDSSLAAFRCLRLIVEDFLDAMDETDETRSALLDCCFSFALSKHDVNTSLTSIGLLWKIADKSGTDKTVELPLSRLARIAADNRAEVRNCAVNTLFSCIVGRGNELSLSQWESCLNDTIIGVYDSVTSSGNQSVTTGDGDDDDDNDEKGPSAKPSRYKLSVHHTRDSEDKQWVSTQAIVVRGICRVLRSFFDELLDSTEIAHLNKKSSDQAPWFEEIWNRFLEFSLAAATAEVSRDTMDLRNAGVDLMVLCCQLSCRAGAQAAITPARVSTNMEVVNGALRSVRTPEKDSLSSASLTRSNSSVVEMWRENLFLDAFDVLESYREYVESSNYTTDSTQIQILAKFGNDLGKLYDCCEPHEFREKDYSALLLSDEPDTSPEAKTDESQNGQSERPLIAQFLSILMTVATSTQSSPNSRFLSLAQKASMDVLKAMASSGSCKATIQLADMVGSNFLWENKNSEGSSLLGMEAASILSHAVKQKDVPPECKVFILTRIFQTFRNDWETSENYALAGEAYTFKAVTSMLEHGLQDSLLLTSSSKSSVGHKLLQRMWDCIEKGLDIILSSISTMPEETMTRDQFHSDIADLVKALAYRVPDPHTEKVCRSLSSVAPSAFEHAKAASQKREKPSEASAREKAMLTLFMSMFFATVSLQPQNDDMQTLTNQIFLGAVTAVQSNSNGESEVPSYVDASLRICRELMNMKGVDPFIVAIYSALGSLIATTTNEGLRHVAGNVLRLVDIGKIISNTQERLEKAETRASKAETRCDALLKAVEELQQKNEKLERQFSAVSAGGAFG